MPEDQSTKTFTLAPSHPFHTSTEAPPSENTMASTSHLPETNIPLTTLPPPPTYAGPSTRSRNLDLEAGLPAPNNASGRHSSEALPEYKEQDMPEPLPPYMTRVRGVMRGQQPMSAAVPQVQRRTKWITLGFFALAVIIVIGVGIGVRVAATNNNNNNNNPPL